MYLFGHKWFRSVAEDQKKEKKMVVTICIRPRARVTLMMMN